jgi:hypothetical protein
LASNITAVVVNNGKNKTEITQERTGFTGYHQSRHYFSA